MATIETRRTADGITGYRAKIRLKGFPSHRLPLGAKQMQRNGRSKQSPAYEKADILRLQKQKNIQFQILLTDISVKLKKRILSVLRTLKSY